MLTVGEGQLQFRLGRRGLVERDASGRYRPGMGLVALGLGALGREPVVAAARPLLEADAAELGETVFLVGARAGRLIVLDKGRVVSDGTGEEDKTKAEDGPKEDGGVEPCTT